MVRGRLRGMLLSACVLLAGCNPAAPAELLANARTAIAAGDLRTAEIHLKNLLQQAPNDTAARILLGEVLLSVGDFAGAEQTLRRALAAGPEGVASELPLLRALVAQQKFAEALDLIESQGLPRNDTDRGALALLQGAAYRGTGQRERAEEVYRAALAADPRSPTIRTELAATLLDLRRVDEASDLIAAVLADDPNFVAALLLRAGVEVARGEQSAGETTLQQLIVLERERRSPLYALALAQLVEVQLLLGKIDSAAGNADTLLALNERNPSARYVKALVEVQQGNLAPAEARLEGVIADVPEYWPAHRLLGVINLRQEQFGQAAMYLQTAVNNNPADNVARRQLAEIHVRQGDLGAARQLLEGSSVGDNEGLFLAFAGSVSQRAGLTDQATSYFDASEQTTAPTDLQELVGLSSLYMAAGEFERAIRILQSASLGDDQSEQVSDYLLALIHMRQGDLPAADAVARRFEEQQGAAAWPLNLRGTIALMSADHAGAEELFTRALELEPDNIAATLNLARVAMARNDAPEAERRLRRALEIDPAQPIALVGLAQLMAQRSNFPEAHALLARAPESSFRVRAEADLFTAEGRFDEAAPRFAQLFALQPSEELALRAYETASRAGRPDADAQLRQWSSEHPQDVMSNFVLAQLALTENDRADAERRYEAVISVNPNHAATLNNLAWLYGERGDARAISFGERAIALQPNNPSIADTLGWLYVQNGDAARGLPLLEQSAAALADEREVQYHFGVALAETGESARAIEVLQRATADGRDFPSRADAERRLASLRRAAQ